MDIPELLRILRSSWAIVVSVALLAICADAVYLTRSPERFASVSTVTLELEHDQKLSHAEQKALERTIRRLVVSFERDEPLAEIADQVGAIEVTQTSGSPFEFSGSFGRMDLSVEVPKNTGAVNFTATAPSSRLSAALASASAQVMHVEASEMLSVSGDQDPAIAAVRTTEGSVPREAAPKYLLNLSLSAACGAFLGAGVAYIVHTSRRKQHE